MLTLSAERGGDPDRPGKRNPLDPLLWRTEREGEPSWASPMGPGRPGWHIECAAIAGNRLGPTIDVQGGGSDLIFPHHECSAAHSEVLTGVAPFARHYAHAGMISLDGEKMSKSRGNLVFVSRLLADGVDPMAIRVALLAGHYRADRPWSDDLLDAAAQPADQWRPRPPGRHRCGRRRRARPPVRGRPWPTTWTRRPRWPSRSVGGRRIAGRGACRRRRDALLGIVSLSGLRGPAAAEESPTLGPRRQRPHAIRRSPACDRHPVPRTDAGGRELTDRTVPTDRRTAAPIDSSPWRDIRRPAEARHAELSLRIPADPGRNPR